jgi:hypothetical protein
MIDNKLRFEELIEEIKRLCPDTTTSIKIVINCEETRLTMNHRHPEQLKQANISMRNIKGNFIK